MTGNGRWENCAKILICTERANFCKREKWVCIIYTSAYASFDKNENSKKLVVQECITYAHTYANFDRKRNPSKFGYAIVHKL